MTRSELEDSPSSRPRPLVSGNRIGLEARHQSHVLFVDDDESNLVVWEAGCSNEFRVLTAQNAESALAMLRSHEVGVIISDQRMPGKSGIELLEQVREEFPETIRILITAYSDLEASIDAINRGQVRRYLRKPCSLSELKVEVADALDLYSLREKVREAEKRLLLTERVYALGVVATGLGKELGRPATTIIQSLISSRTELHTLAERAASGASLEPRGLRAKLQEIDEYLERAQLGVERVMDIARSIEPPPSTGDNDPVQLADVLRVALKVVRGEIRRGTDVALDIRPVPAVRGTAAKLGQVVLNLLVNAIDAVAERPQADRSIVIRLTELGSMVCLEVSDNGASISDRDKDRVFDPLHGGSSARSSGLGLAISRAIVEEVGGALELATSPDGTTSFRVTLPMYTSIA